MTVYCEISVPEAHLMGSCRCPFHSCTIFEVCLINFLRFSGIIFSHSAFHIGLFFRRKRKPKTFGFKNVTERGNIVKSHFLKTLNCI